MSSQPLTLFIRTGQGENEHLLAAWRERFWSLRCAICPSHKDSNVQQATVSGPTPPPLLVISPATPEKPIA